MCRGIKEHSPGVANVLKLGGGSMTGFYYSLSHKFARHSLQCNGLIIYLHVKLAGKKLTNHGRETNGMLNMGGKNIVFGRNQN